jgi:hypothetical protein
MEPVTQVLLSLRRGCIYMKGRGDREILGFKIVSEIILNPE